jgi:hypothetical protein
MNQSSKRAGRPVLKRAKDTLLRDVQHMSNLRTAILTDDSIDREIANRIADQIESLTQSLIELLRTK